MHYEYEEEKSPWFWDEAWLSVKQRRLYHYLCIVYWSEYGNSVAFVISSRTSAESSVCLYHRVPFVCKQSQSYCMKRCFTDAVSSFEDILSSSGLGCLSQIVVVGVNALVWARYSGDQMDSSNQMRRRRSFLKSLLSVSAVSWGRVLIWSRCCAEMQLQSVKNTKSEGFALYNNPGWIKACIYIYFHKFLDKIPYIESIFMQKMLVNSQIMTKVFVY